MIKVIIFNIESCLAAVLSKMKGDLLLSKFAATHVGGCKIDVNTK